HLYSSLNTRAYVRPLCLHLLSSLSSPSLCPSSFFFFNDPATTEIYTLSLHDALPIFGRLLLPGHRHEPVDVGPGDGVLRRRGRRSEEHTSELQSRGHLVCRLLLEKKKKN